MKNPELELVRIPMERRPGHNTRLRWCILCGKPGRATNSGLWHSLWLLNDWRYVHTGECAEALRATLALSGKCTFWKYWP